MLIETLFELLLLLSVAYCRLFGLRRDSSMMRSSNLVLDEAVAATRDQQKVTTMSSS